MIVTASYERHNSPWKCRLKWRNSPGSVSKGLARTLHARSSTCVRHDSHLSYQHLQIQEGLEFLRSYESWRLFLFTRRRTRSTLVKLGLRLGCGVSVKILTEVSMIWQTLSGIRAPEWVFTHLSVSCYTNAWTCLGYKEGGNDMMLECCEMSVGARQPQLCQ